MNYQVKATNKRGYTQEELFKVYKDALHFALECKDSDQYKVITINKFCINNNQYFLERIVK